MLITFMVGLYPSTYLLVVLDGLQKKKIYKIDLAKYEKDSKKGLILEVDLEYPPELHNLHNDYPLLPEK